MRTRPGRSVTKSLPSGAMSTAHGARNPDATSCTFSTTAGPMRGEGVGVGLAVEGGAVVGIGIVVVRFEKLAGGGDTHEARRSAISPTTARGVARDTLSSVGVFGASGPWRTIHRDPTRGRAKKTPALLTARSRDRTRRDSRSKITREPHAIRRVAAQASAR